MSVRSMLFGDCRVELAGGESRATALGERVDPSTAALANRVEQAVVGLLPEPVKSEHPDAA